MTPMPIFASVDDDASLLVLAALLAIYFLPSLIGVIFRRPNRAEIFLMNFLLGWTFFGWIAAILLCVVNDTEKNSPPTIHCPHCGHSIKSQPS